MLREHKNQAHLLMDWLFFLIEDVSAVKRIFEWYQMVWHEYPVS